MLLLRGVLLKYDCENFCTVFIMNHGKPFFEYYFLNCPLWEFYLNRILLFVSRLIVSLEDQLAQVFLMLLN